jgi:hypothetical protein
MTNDAKRMANNTLLAKVHGGGELFGLVYQSLLGFGLVSGAAVVAFMGKLFAAGILAFFGLLVLLRLKRGRVRK